MTPSEAEEFVLCLLRTKGPLTTMELEKLADQEHRRCPDQTVLFLTKMRGNGLIEGAPSFEKRGWLWQLPADAQTPPG
ncbi:MAG: hypothetical protein LN411_02815 [Candidatus Thermoplasmatota archaeon]|nr:hypothetical protein [Candidatus Thermoplasmatota archaeon]